MKYTGSVVCPASSMMHISKLAFVSKGLVIPRQVIATTLTSANRLVISSTLKLSFAVRNVTPHPGQI